MITIVIILYAKTLILAILVVLELALRLDYLPQVSISLNSCKIKNSPNHLIKMQQTLLSMLIQIQISAVLSHITTLG